MANTAMAWKRDSGPMSDMTYSRLAEFIHSELGIKMPEVKKTMLQGRLLKRLRHLSMSSYDEYMEYLFSPEGAENELQHLFDTVTTNKTDFFREPRHFEILVREVLPRLRARGLNRKVQVWSAACSSGEEPFTLAMVLSEFAEGHPGFSFSILATDISTRVLRKAMTGIYEEGAVTPIPPRLRKKYLLRGKDEKKGLVRIVPELRSLIRFQQINLMDEDYGFRESMDIIFCRNVIIYFDRATQGRVLNSLVSRLRPDGYLFTGHSETLNGLNVPVVPVALTVYRKPQ